MPIWLTILSGAAGIVGVILSIYVVVDSKVGVKRKRLDNMEERLGDHEIRLAKTERVTEVVEDFMEDLLMEALNRGKKRRQ